jgi:hypothetical protein
VSSQIIAGLAFGFFFVAFGAYQLATKTLITGGRKWQGTQFEKGSPLLYVFAPLEILVGLAAFGGAGAMLLHANTFVSSCNQRATALECTELHGSGWERPAMNKMCVGAQLTETECPEDNKLGTCNRSDGSNHEWETTFYAGFVNRKAGIWQPTQQEQAALCARRGGVWKPFS